jgi:hypothetical protein
MNDIGMTAQMTGNRVLSELSIKNELEVLSNSWAPPVIFPPKDLEDKKVLINFAAW